MATIFKAIRHGSDEIEIMQYHIDNHGCSVTIGPVARFDTTDRAGFARAKAYLEFLNEHSEEWPQEYRPGPRGADLELCPAVINGEMVYVSIPED